MIGVVYLDGCVFGDDLVVDLETSFFVILRFGRGCFGFLFLGLWLIGWRIGGWCCGVWFVIVLFGRLFG